MLPAQSRKPMARYFLILLTLRFEFAPSQNSVAVALRAFAMGGCRDSPVFRRLVSMTSHPSHDAYAHMAQAVRFEGVLAIE